MNTDNFQIRQAWHQKTMSNIASGLPITLGHQCHGRLFFSSAIFDIENVTHFHCLYMCGKSHICCEKLKSHITNKASIAKVGQVITAR